MKLLLDSHILLALTQFTLEERYPRQAALLSRAGHDAHVSVASLWEIAIKVRLKKLDLGMDLQAYGRFVDSLGFTIISVEVAHALMSVAPEPPTRDPFDRMLLAQCAVEGMRLVTVDRALAAHPLAWRPG